MMHILFYTALNRWRLIFLIVLGAGCCCPLLSQNQLSFDLVWEENIFPNNPYTIVFDQLDRPYFYVANDNGGIRIYKNEPGADPTQVAQLTTDNWNDLKVMDATQQGAFLYLPLGSFFDGDMQEYGMAIVDISDPETPFMTDYWIDDQLGKGTAIVRLQDNYAFLGAMSNGLIIFDVSNPADIQEVARIVPDPDFPVPNPGATMEPNARGMAIADDLVYLCYDAGGISVVDISNITSPEEVHRYIHSDFINLTQQAYNNAVLHGDLLFVAIDYCGVEVLDVSDPHSITQVSIWNPWDCETLDNLWIDSPGHTNQLGFLPGHEGEILIVNGNDTELIALDVSNPADPQLIGSFGETGDQLRTWGLGIGEGQIAGAYYFTLLPWPSAQARVKLFEWELTTVVKTPVRKHIVVSPNPVSHQLTIDLGEDISGEAVLEWWHPSGNMAWSQRVDLVNGSAWVDLAEKLLNGIYLIKVQPKGRPAFVGKVVGVPLGG